MRAWFAIVLVAGLAVSSGAARAEDKAKPKAPAKTAAANADTAASWHSRRAVYFRRNWGVDIVGVRRVASGWMLRFDYRVVDPELAAPLIDRKVKPYLVDDATGTALAVPAMEKVGELRQVGPLEVDRTYFILFGNPAGLVKRGGRVTLVIGNFRADGMVVE